jgi:hypothetical protein
MNGKSIKTVASTARKSTAQIARLMAAQGTVSALKQALAVEAATWPEGTWSADQETRLSEKGAASNELWGKQTREAWEMVDRYGEERRLLNKLAFAEAVLARLVR